MMTKQDLPEERRLAPTACNKGNVPKVNYQKKLEETIAGEAAAGRTPRLLLHSCCAPCSSYVLEYLSDFFLITVLYYNPNISQKEEYEKRIAEEQRLIAEMPTKYPVTFLAGTYEPKRFFEAVRGLEQCKEGGERCEVCFRLRLTEAAKIAAEGGFDYFTTTLSISPLKNAELLNSLGREISDEYGVPYLYSDFKKKNGYRRSVELSAQYKLYRQDYCGCVYSKQQREAEKLLQEEERKAK